ncbi:MAG: hypothetical protein QM817_31685 [Archangium sp.]
MHASLPMPDDPEASIARALFIRDLEQPLRQFWTREAAALGEGVDDDDLREVDARWRKLAREGVLSILHSTSNVTRKVLDVVNRFPTEERDYAWSVERARLSDPSEQQRVEDAFAAQMLGPGFSSDVGWIVRLNRLRQQGDNLRERWRAWNRSDARVKELTLPRDVGLEQAVIEQPTSLERRLLYAEWLAEQNGGASLGEYIQLSAANATSWRAELLVEHDCSVVGPLVGSAVSLDWRLGFICAATSWTSELRLLFTHAAAFTIERVELIPDESFTLPARAPCLKVASVLVKESLESDAARRLRDGLRELADVAPLAEVIIQRGNRRIARNVELRQLLEEISWKVKVTEVFDE